MRIYLFATGFSRVPKGLFVKGAPWKSVQFPILNAIVEDNEDLILLDTGLGTRILEEMKLSKYRGQAFFNRYVMKTAFNPASDPLLHQLPDKGFDLSAVKYVILSHLHWDHAGGIRDFPNARFIIGKKEWEAANAADSNKHAYIREQFESIENMNINLISTIPNKPFLGFPDSLDLFGDGRFIMVDLPGHSVGSMGLFVTLPSGRRFLFPGDSFYFPENLEWMAPKSTLMQKLVHENPKAIETLEILHNLAKTEPDLEIVSYHDHRIPGKYQLAPIYYE